MAVFNEDTRVKVPATIQFLRLNGKGGHIIFGIDDKTRDVVGIVEDLVFQEIFGSR